MKKLIYLLLIIIPLYAGALFRSPYLTAFGIAEALFFAAAFLLSRIMIGGISVRFGGDGERLVPGGEGLCTLLVVNRRPVPSPEVCVRAGQGEEEEFEFLFPLGKEERSLILPLHPAHCGLLRPEVTHLSAKDLSGLFNPRIRRLPGFEIAVFPPPLRMRLVSADEGETPRIAEKTAAQPGEDRSEVRQIRPYTGGDPVRHIHWPLSAKLDELYVREFQRESEREIPLHIPVDGIGDLTDDAADAFFSVLSALLAGLSEREGRIRVTVTRENAGAISMDGNDPDALLLFLYRLREEEGGNGAAPDGKMRAAVQGINAENGENEDGGQGTEEGLLLDLSPALYGGGSVIFRFSRERYAEEIGENIFIIQSA